jgi:hypothetical protein
MPVEIREKLLLKIKEAKKRLKKGRKVAEFRKKILK